MKHHLENLLRPIVLSFLVTASLAALAPLAICAQDRRGEQLFNAKCTPCHTIGGGRKVGPDLKGVTADHPKAWLFSFISDPDKMFNANDPMATGMLKEYGMKMPNLGLSPEEVNAVIGYLESQSAGAPKAKAVPSSQAGQAPASSGDARLGEGYFSGRIAFSNSGPPCMACHSVRGIKYLGGGSLGPDLTTAYSALGHGIVPMLVNVPFPTMKPIFDDHPLTAQEARDVAAFLQNTASQQPESDTSRVIAVSIIAGIVPVIVMLLVWRTRLVTVRKALVARAEEESDR